MGKRMLDSLPELMKNPQFKKDWDALAPEFSLASALVEARIRAGMTQAQVAEKMGVSQPIIARMESGRNLSIKSIQRYATATGQAITIELLPA